MIEEESRAIQSIVLLYIVMWSLLIKGVKEFPKNGGKEIIKETRHIKDDSRIYSDLIEPSNFMNGE